MYSKDDITPEIREKSRQLLDYIKLRIEYKRRDLTRKMSLEKTRSYPALNEVFASVLSNQESQRSKTREFQLDDPDIIEAIMSLSPLQQLILWKVFIERNNQVDTAKQLGLSSAAMLKAKKRALNELAKKMNKQ